MVSRARHPEYARLAANLKRLTWRLEDHDGAQTSGDKRGTWIEAQIRVAMEEGAFDNLPGAGKPIPNLGQEYDPLSRWVKQLAQREQISMLPPSLELLRKVDKELAAIESLQDEATVRRLVSTLNVEIAKVNATVLEGPPTRLSTLDVDQVVAQWRRTRSTGPQRLSRTLERLLPMPRRRRCTEHHRPPPPSSAIAARSAAHDLAEQLCGL